MYVSRLIYMTNHCAPQHVHEVAYFTVCAKTVDGDLHALLSKACRIIIMSVCTCIIIYFKFVGLYGCWYSHGFLSFGVGRKTTRAGDFSLHMHACT